MTKQKICIIGGGLTGLITAATLGRLNLNIDLFDNDFYCNLGSLRTTAISNSNHNFLEKINILNVKNKNFWQCSKIELYDGDINFKNQKIFKFKNNENKKTILHMIENKKISKIIKGIVKKNKRINIKSNVYITKLFSKDSLKFVETSNKSLFKYNLVILCTGKNSSLTKNFLGSRYFNYSYDEVSIALNILHDSTNNSIARQFFLKEGLVAFLPISDSKTSIIFSIKKSFLNNKKNKDMLIKKYLTNLSKNIYKNIKFDSKFEYKDLNFHLSHKCFNERVLVFGDAMHSVHPLVGQGFNMIIRDLIKLEKIIKTQINLGLDIGSSSLLSDVLENIKSNNFIFSSGINVVKQIFSTNNPILKNFRNYSLKKLDSNINAKNFFIKIADEGINL